MVGVKGAADNVTVWQALALVPHILLDATQTLPDVALVAQVTSALVVPFPPEVIVPPVTTQL